MAIRVVQLLTLGNISSSRVRELIRPVHQHLGITAERGKIQLAVPTYAFNKDRRQYHASAILRRLASLADQRLSLAVTEVPLFEPDSTFIYGESDREHRVGVVSFSNMGDELGDSAKRRRREDVETIHQVGRLIGLSLCEDARCVMSVSTTPAELDRKNINPCNACRNELAKLLR